MQPQRNALQVGVRPAPTSGMDARAPIGNMPDANCVYTYNLMPAEYGMLLRPGYREHCIGLDNGALSGGVRTIVPFTGLAPGAVDDYLFAMTNEGIWNVTDEDAPVFMQAFTDPAATDSGHGVYCHYVDDAARDYLLYADAADGLWEFDNSTIPGTWGRPTGITAPIESDFAIENVVFCMIHKQRLWLIEEGSSSAWYLPVGSKAGEVTAFHFGAKFPHGGRLYALYNWSIDGGLGLDDFLVAVSSSGDVVLYQGADPSASGLTDTAPWTIKGSYYIGDIPRGRRVGSEYGGTLYILSAYGLVAINDLLSGVRTPQDDEGSLAFPVSRPLRRDVYRKINDLGWEPIFLPPLGQLVITTPKGPDRRHIQYTMNIATKGWGLLRDLPAQCAEDFAGKVYIGTPDGRVCAMDVPSDNILLTPPAEGLNGEPVSFSILSNYTDGGSPGIFKQVQLVRPNFWSSSPPSYDTKVLYDFNYAEPSLYPPVLITSADSWDTGLWDTAIWSGGVGKGQFSLLGAGGIGRAFGIAMRGEAREEVRFVHWDTMWTAGGPV